MNAWAELGRGPKNRAEPHKNPHRLRASCSNHKLQQQIWFHVVTSSAETQKRLSLGCNLSKKKKMETEIKAAD